MVVLDAVLFPLETDREPVYYFYLMGLFALVTVIGLALSFRWKHLRYVYTASKKATVFSYVTLAIGFLLIIPLFVDEQKYLTVGAAGFGLLIVGFSSLLSAVIGLNVKKQPSFRINCIFRAFPKDVHQSVGAVIKWLKRRRLIKAGGTTSPILYYHDFDKVILPVTVNLPDLEYKTDDDNAKTVYDCLQTRNPNGHIREKYIKEILKGGCPRWAIPFVIEASTDRVVEIVNAIYNGISDQLEEEIGIYYKNDLVKFRHDYSKTISYWNAYYRSVYPNYKDYPGYKLFTERYGYKKRYHKKASRIAELWDLYGKGKLEEIPFLLCNYYSGVMGEGHAGFLFNVDNHGDAEDRIADYVEKLKDVLGAGLYCNLIRAVDAYGTNNEAKICDLADEYFQDREDEYIALLKRYAEEICEDE